MTGLLGICVSSLFHKKWNKELENESNWGYKTEFDKVSTKPDPNLIGVMNLTKSSQRNITFKHGLVDTTFTQKLLPFAVKHALTQKVKVPFLFK